MIAWYHTKSGGVGLEDLSLSPESSGNHWSDHVKLVLSKQFDEPFYYSCSVPVYDKLACSRGKLDVEMRLPTVEIGELVTDLGTPSEDTDPNASVWGDMFYKHPTVCRAIAGGLPWYKIRPIAIYTDGVPSVSDTHPTLPKNQPD